MNEHERNFLLAEFNASWQMVLSLDQRRDVFLRYYNLIFLGVLGLGISLIHPTARFSFVTMMGITIISFLAVLGGEMVWRILVSERRANIRYRRKINLIRHVFLFSADDPSISFYLTKGTEKYSSFGKKDDLGVLLYRDDDKQPSGYGQTLRGIRVIIRLQQFVLLLATAGLWVIWRLTDQQLNLLGI